MSLTDTQIINVNSDPHLAFNFINLSGYNVLNKFVNSETIQLFALDINNNIEYGSFSKQLDNTYLGSWKILNQYSDFTDCSNITVINSYYKQNEEYYIFYNKNDNIYVRQFVNTHGYFSEEFLVREGYRISKIEEIEENIIMAVFEVLNASVFATRPELGFGISTLLFVYENDLEKYIAGDALELRMQKINAPFNDIAETSWSCKNKVPNNDGFLYFSNPDCQLIPDTYSINGTAFANLGDMFVKVNGADNAYTMNLRCKLYPWQLFNITGMVEQNANYVISGANGSNISGSLNFETKGDYLLSTFPLTTISGGLDVIGNEIETNVITLPYAQYIDPKNIIFLDQNMVPISGSNKIQIAFMDITNGETSFGGYDDYSNILHDKMLTDSFKIKISIADPTTQISSFLIPYLETVKGNLPKEVILIQGNNFYISYNDHQISLRTDIGRSRLTNYFAINANEPCKKYKQEYPGQPPIQEVTMPWDNKNEYKTFSLSVKYDDTINGQSIRLYIDNNKLSIDRYPTVAITKDKLIEMYNVERIDYLSVHRRVIESYEINSIQRALKNEIVYNKINKEILLDYTKLNGVFDVGDVYQICNSLDSYITNLNITELMPISAYGIDNKPQLKIGDTIYSLPLSNPITSVIKTDIYLIKNSSPVLESGVYKITYEEIPQTQDILQDYPNNYLLNNAYKFKYGKKLPITPDLNLSNSESMVLPYTLTFDSDVPSSIFSDPEKNLRVCYNFTQQANYPSFIIEDKVETSEYIIWTNFKNTHGYIPIQFSLDNEDIINSPTYSDYLSISNGTYNPDEYFCAYHFDKLLDQRHILVKNFSFYNAGELILKGKTAKTEYIREIEKIRYFETPQKYKTSYFKLQMDVLDINNRDSYITSNDKINAFAKKIVELWKPAHTSLTKIEQKNTLIMSELLTDQFTQVLVGFTPGSNVNSYYIRNTDDGAINIFSSTRRYDESIDWIAIPKIDTNFVKAGVTKIFSPIKNTKIFFETRFTQEGYRVFVFSPNNSKYYCPLQDKDGFVVESSYLLEDEVAWIALNTNQVVNGALHWTYGIREGRKRIDNLSRIRDIDINSHLFSLKFNDFGYENFNNTEYAVIMSSDSNLNIWHENKKTNGFDVRRSYSGQEVKINYLCVPSAVKWWSTLTG